MWLRHIGRYYLQRTTRKAKFWKPKHYQAIPHYVKPHFIDIHDTYTTRSYEEVMKQMKDKQFDIQIELVVYKPTDIRRDFKGRKAILIAPMAQFQLTELQQARFETLVGCRYNKQKNELKLTCELFDDFQQNHTKIHEMFYQIVMESKRAP